MVSGSKHHYRLLRALQRYLAIPPDFVSFCYIVECQTKIQLFRVIDRLSIIWKSDLSDKIKLDFFQTVMVLILLDECTTWTLKKRLHKNTKSYCEPVLEATPHKIIALRLLTAHRKCHQRKTNKTCVTLLEKQGQTYK